MEKIGAHGLHTVMTPLLENVVYELRDRASTKIVVDKATVRARVRSIVEDEDPGKYSSRRELSESFSLPTGP